MRALTFHGRRDIRLEDIPEPEPGPGEVRVRVTDCLLSQNFVDFNVEGHFADLSTPHPLTGIGTGYVMGQQFGGTIEAVGEGVDAQRIGTQVGIAPGVGCGNCSPCGQGQLNYCDQLSYYGLLGRHGGMAQRCVVLDSCAVPVPSRIHGVLLEGLLVVHNLLRKSQPWIAKDQPVLVLGAGPIGLCAAAMLRDFHGARPILHDVLPGRRARAAECRFPVAGAAELREQYHLVLDCAGTNPETGGSALSDGLERVCKGGALMYVGTYLHETRIASLDLLFREVQLGAAFAYTQRDLDELVPRLPELKLNLDPITERMTLEEAAKDGLLRGEVERESFSAILVGA